MSPPVPASSPRSLEEPLKQIAVNAGHEGGVVTERVRALDGVSEGLNAATGEYEDLTKAGIIDAAKVTRSALQNAASIAALFSPPRPSSPTSPRRRAPRQCPAAAWRTSKLHRGGGIDRRRGGPGRVPLVPSPLRRNPVG